MATSLLQNGMGISLRIVVWQQQTMKIKMYEYECYFYADKALLQPYIEVQTGAPSMEVTRDECRRYTSDSHEFIYV